jgi:hypothetical protein
MIEDKHKNVDVKFECIRLALRKATDLRLPGIGRAGDVSNSTVTTTSVIKDAEEFYKWVNKD